MSQLRPADRRILLYLQQVLDPAVHSLSYLALLETLLPSEGQPQDVEPVLADKIVSFLVSFDARQVRYIGAPFTSLFTAVASGQIIPVRAPVCKREGGESVMLDLVEGG